ncbi:MAG: DNA repair protein RadA [uncultured Chloroflexi bacterium]|uniref:DNA repair protein RadA n=1 Tax=uncultured Chloroflexota bacterium TaxID=166587 RepID=A0A6J4K2F3_9CHLR|nr:MAG: DNA repair protein RadA [uncultured Chloroflexota bacterium]
MPRTKTFFTCQQCGAEAAKWLGRCPECSAWNSYTEEAKVTATARAVAAGLPADSRARPGAVAPERLADVSTEDAPRLHTGMGELDRVLGGGIVPGSLVLIGGDPGIGKSTLLLQTAANVAAQGGTVLYVSGEESARQVRLRAERLEAVAPSLYVLAETSLDSVLSQVDRLQPQLMIVDSIQTAYLEDVASSPGNVAQLRECTLRLMNLAKARELPIFLVGHVTKEGTIAGPRVLEHIVDCVLYLEGERFYSYRLLRAAKNRFGSTNEIGVFEMEQGGMREVANPSAAFLSERAASTSGSAVTMPLEGSRALLVEVQALTAGTSFGAPRRTAVGIDQNRLALLVAVLGKRLGLQLGSQDVYVNVVAGLKIAEPAVDLGVALAIGSSARETPIDRGTVAVGEIGLGGELRTVSQIERRLSEAARLGFERAIIPAADYRLLTGSRSGGAPVGLELQGAGSVAEAFELALGPAPTAAARGRADRRPEFAGMTAGRSSLDALIDESLLDEPL